MRNIILQAIAEYVVEPQEGVYEIRAIPSPEILADWIVEAINEKLV